MYFSDVVAKCYRMCGYNAYADSPNTIKICSRTIPSTTWLSKSLYDDLFIVLSWALFEQYGVASYLDDYIARRLK